MSIDSKTTEVLEELISLGYQKPIIYGSWSEYFNYEYDSKYPNDIDVINIVYEEELCGEFQLKLKCIDIPVNVECMTASQMKEDCKKGEMKYYNLYPIIIPSLGHTAIYHGTIGLILSEMPKSKTRSICSNSASNAFNKGKKKLTVLEDFDKVLGLKNIWHSINFPHQIMRWHNRVNIDSTADFEINRFKEEFNVMNLIDIRDRIYEIYDSTEGDYLQKAKAVLDYAKPIHNAAMSEFRKYFPKD